MKKTSLFIAAMACSFETLAPLAVFASPDGDTINADTVNSQPPVVTKKMIPRSNR